MKEQAIIIDIDGTLANIDHRRSKLQQTNDWDEFNSSMKLDDLNIWCAEIIKRFITSHKIILVTGRNKKFEEVTTEWLTKNDIKYDDLFFREDDDFRADEIVKKAIYDTYIEKKYEVFFVVDDRNKVVKMWRELGLTCLQCLEGDF